MSGYISEMFGIPAQYADEGARAIWAKRICPFLGEVCLKRRHDGTPAGVCAVRMAGNETPVICCPQRLYGDDDNMLKSVASDAFELSEDEFTLVAGDPAAREAAKTSDKTVIAVFGHGWGHELPLPVPSDMKGYCSIDWILVRLGDQGEPVEFCAAEVQTIDTTGTHANAAKALLETGEIVKDTVGLNWANVRKRIFQQIVYKGQVLERESRCRKGLYYVIPRPVFENNFKSLGGEALLPRFPQRPGTMTFFVYDYAPDTEFEADKHRPMAHVDSYTTGIHKLQEAFSNYLPHESDLYFKAIRTGLGLPND